MIVAQTFFDEFHPGQTVPAKRYAAEAIAVMAEQGMVTALPDPAPEPEAGVFDMPLNDGTGRVLRITRERAPEPEPKAKRGKAQEGDDDGSS